jgi:hypothetical protein
MRVTPDQIPLVFEADTRNRVVFGVKYEEVSQADMEAAGHG